MREKLVEIIKMAISELNEQLEDDKKLTYSEDLRLIGKSSNIDSMDFVTLISIIEELVVDEMNKDIHIVSDKAFSKEHSPFYSVNTLIDFIEELIQEAE